MKAASTASRHSAEKSPVVVAPLRARKAIGSEAGACANEDDDVRGRHGTTTRKQCGQTGDQTETRGELRQEHKDKEDLSGVVAGYSRNAWLLFIAVGGEKTRATFSKLAVLLRSLGSQNAIMTLPENRRIGNVF